ncbi:MAG TPA: ATP synthase F1 subunit delta [Vicinamibacteria bacterium]|nr:ATP synthase F1 subunit delta [Vicinamibacteria bacterium]
MRRSTGAFVLAGRYASALLAVAVEKKADEDRIASELDGVAAFFSRHRQLAEVLASPRILPAKRVRVLEELLSNEKLTTYTLNVLRLLTLKDRLPILEEVSRQFTRLVMEHKGIQSGEVVSAHPLTRDQQTRLAKSLGKALDKKMQLSFRTDSELVGGLVVRIGNRIFDASVAAELRQFRQRALSGF